MRRQPAWHRSHRALPARYWNVAFRDLASHVPLLAGGLLAQVQRLMSIRQQKEKARGQMTEIQKEVDHLGCKERPLLARNSPSCE